MLANLEQHLFHSPNQSGHSSSAGSWSGGMRFQTAVEEDPLTLDARNVRLLQTKPSFITVLTLNTALFSKFHSGYPNSIHLIPEHQPFQQLRHQSEQLNVKRGCTAPHKIIDLSRSLSTIISSSESHDSNEAHKRNLQLQIRSTTQTLLTIFTSHRLSPALVRAEHH